MSRSTWMAASSTSRSLLRREAEFLVLLAGFVEQLHRLGLFLDALGFGQALGLDAGGDGEFLVLGALGFGLGLGFRHLGVSVALDLFHLGFGHAHGLDRFGIGLLGAGLGGDDFGFGQARRRLPARP